MSLVDVIILQIIDNQIKSRFGENINKRWKNLQRIFSTPKNNQIVPEQIEVLEDIPSGVDTLE